MAVQMNETFSNAESNEYACAFCKGKGVDPFGVMSFLSLCVVCLGKGFIELPGTVHKCAYCKGKGESPTGTRCTCPACRGKGLIPIKEPVSTCPDCQGKGTKDNWWYCIGCHGAGLVSLDVLVTTR